MTLPPQLHTTSDQRLHAGTGGSICILQAIKDYRRGQEEVSAYYKPVDLVTIHPHTQLVPPSSGGSVCHFIGGG